MQKLIDFALFTQHDPLHYSSGQRLSTSCTHTKEFSGQMNGQMDQISNKVMFANRKYLCTPRLFTYIWLSQGRLQRVGQARHTVRFFKRKKKNTPHLAQFESRTFGLIWFIYTISRKYLSQENNKKSLMHSHFLRQATRLKVHNAPLTLPSNISG